MNSPRIIALSAVCLLCATLISAPARAQTCTLNPTFTATVTGREAPIASVELVGKSIVSVQYATGAAPAPNASCSNMTQSTALSYGPLGSVGTSGNYLPYTIGGSDPASGTATATPGAGKYRFRGTFGCACGALSGPTQNVDLDTVVVPPTINVSPQLLDLTAGKLYAAGDSVPAGASYTVSVFVADSALCVGDKVSYQFSGAGVTASTDVSGPDAGTDCIKGSAATSMTIKPTTPGPLTLVATFDGTAASNTVTWNVVAGSAATGGGTGGTGGTGGGAGAGGGTTPMTGCSAVEFGPLGFAAFLLLRARRKSQTV